MSKYRIKWGEMPLDETHSAIYYMVQRRKTFFWTNISMGREGFATIDINKAERVLLKCLNRERKKKSKNISERMKKCFLVISASFKHFASK